MLSSERLAEIRALTWDWKYEDCSDHQSAVNDLLAERDQLAAEGRLLHKWLLDPPRNTSEVANFNYPLIAAEVERVKRLEAVAEAADKPTACFEHADNCCIDWCDLCRQCQQNQDALDAALAAWREGEG